MRGDGMKNRRMAAVVLMTAVLIILQIFPVWAKEEQLMRFRQFLWMERLDGYCMEKRLIKDGQMPALQKS